MKDILESKEMSKENGLGTLKMNMVDNGNPHISYQKMYIKRLKKC